MKPEDPGPLKDKKVREEVRQKNLTIVQDGLKQLEAAVQVDPDYDDAYAYLNLMHRELADLADTPEDYKKEQDLARRVTSRRPSKRRSGKLKRSKRKPLAVSSRNKRRSSSHPKRDRLLSHRVL
jgi:hypothetical protein